MFSVQLWPWWLVLGDCIWYCICICVLLKIISIVNLLIANWYNNIIDTSVISKIWGGLKPSLSPPPPSTPMILYLLGVIKASGIDVHNNSNFSELHFLHELHLIHAVVAFLPISYVVNCEIQLMMTQTNHIMPAWDNMLGNCLLLHGRSVLILITFIIV